MREKVKLSEIKSFNPCTEGWKTLLESLKDRSNMEQEITFHHILKSNGLDHAIWALRTRPLIAVKFAIKCAEKVYPLYEKEYPDDKRVLQAIKAAKNYLKSPNQDADAAYTAARAAYTAAAYAAYTAYTAAYTAARAAARAAAYTAAGYAAYTAAAAAAADAADAAADAMPEIDLTKIYLSCVQ